MEVLVVSSSSVNISHISIVVIIIIRSVVALTWFMWPYSKIITLLQWSCTCFLFLFYQRYSFVVTLCYFCSIKIKWKLLREINTFWFEPTVGSCEVTWTSTGGNWKEVKGRCVCPCYSTDIKLQSSCFPSLRAALFHSPRACEEVTGSGVPHSPPFWQKEEVSTV